MCGVSFNADHAIVCRKGCSIVQPHIALRDFEEEMLSMVCNDVEIETVLQEITGERLNRGAKGPFIIYAVGWAGRIHQ